MTSYSAAKDLVYSSRYSPYSSNLAYSNAYAYGSQYRSGVVTGAPRSHEWTEYQPVERKYVDYVPETRVEYKPVERVAQDYVEIKHVTDYEAQPRYERRTEYVPVEKVDQYVDYIPRQHSYVSRTPQEGFYRSSSTTSLASSGFRYGSAYPYGGQSNVYGSYGSYGGYGGYSGYGGYGYSSSPYSYRY